MSCYGKVNIVSDSSFTRGDNRLRASTLIEFRNQYYAIDTFYRPDGGCIGSTIWRTNSDGIGMRGRNMAPPITDNKPMLHSDLIVAFEQKLLADHRAKADKRNQAARGRSAAMRLLGYKKTPYGWE
jgi:hypothetical protein